MSKKEEALVLTDARRQLKGAAEGVADSRGCGVEVTHPAGAALEWAAVDFAAALVCDLVKDAVMRSLQSGIDRDNSAEAATVALLLRIRHEMKSGKHHDIRP